MMTQRLVGVILILIITPGIIFSQSDFYFTLNNVKARPLAMGGAYIAMDDDLAAIAYNPAAYFMMERKDAKKINLFINPFSPFVGGIKHEEVFQGSGSKIDDFLLSLGLLLKSVSISINAFQIGVLLGEQSLNLPGEFSNETFFGVAGFRQNHSHSIIGRLRLADKVSIGGVATFLFASELNNPMKRHSELGFSYGVLLKPEKGLHIGVSFFNLPDTLKQFRMPFERIVDESVNLGISYRLFTATQFSLDVRNLGEEAEDAVREFHFGVEQILFSHLALRAGYFQKDKGEHVFSWGFGLLDGMRLFNQDPDLNYPNYYISYAFVYEKSSPVSNRWHFLTFSIRI